MIAPDTGLLTAGETSGHLILEPRGWINRRVETIELLSHEETRRHVSVDFTLDEQTRDGLTTRHGVVVPISVLSKAPLRHFDLRDEGGRAVPAVGRADNSELAYVAALSTALAPQTGKVDPSAFRRVASSVRTVVSGTPDVALHELGSMATRGAENEPLYDALWADADARKLLELLALNYVLFAVLPTVDGAPRRVLKFSYGDDLDLTISHRPKTDPSLATIASRAWRPDRRAFQIECAAADRGASFHAEIAIPEELRVERAEMADRHRASTPRTPGLPSRFSSPARRSSPASRRARASTCSSGPCSEPVGDGWGCRPCAHLPAPRASPWSSLLQRRCPCGSSPAPSHGARHCA